jgi:hypothetical protein
VLESFYEVERDRVAELMRSAEATGVGAVTSFDRAIDRVRTVERVKP